MAVCDRQPEHYQALAVKRGTASTYKCGSNRDPTATRQLQGEPTGIGARRSARRNAGSELAKGTDGLLGKKRASERKVSATLGR